MGHIVFRTSTRRKTLRAKHDPREPCPSRAVEHRLVLPSPTAALQKEMLEGEESYRGTGVFANGSDPRACRCRADVTAPWKTRGAEQEAQNPTPSGTVHARP